MTDVSPRLPNPIRCEIDLDADGKQAGYLRLPHSVHRSAYGWLPVPIASIRNGEGPVVLVMSGNHGDEYEGQVLSSRLMRELTPEAVRGQVIVLPMANFPAAEAGMRTSPLDGGNLNRTFPGDPSGTPTQMIAHYIEHTLLARADYLVDLHSGGSSLIYDGGNLIALDPRDADEELRVKALLGAFGMPRAFLHAPNPTYASAAARRQGAISILTELGGARHDRCEAAAPGLAGAAALPRLHRRGARAARAGRPARRHALHARERTAAFRVCLRARRLRAARRTRRDRAGRAARGAHPFPKTPLREPVVHRFEACGEVVCRRVPAQTRRGDCLFQLAEPHDTL